MIMPQFARVARKELWPGGDALFRTLALAQLRALWLRRLSSLICMRPQKYSTTALSERWAVVDGPADDARLNTSMTTQ